MENRRTDRFSMGSNVRSIGQTVLHRPVELARLLVNWEFGRKASFREDSSELAAAFTSFDQGSELFKVVDDKIRTWILVCWRIHYDLILLYELLAGILCGLQLMTSRINL
jgi:hypothetical protein